LARQLRFLVVDDVVCAAVACVADGIGGADGQGVVAVSREGCSGQWKVPRRVPVVIRTDLAEPNVPPER